MECTKYKVLLIEDNKLDRMAFERFVYDQNLQYDYTAAQSISEAKELLESEQFDIIVTDYSLGDGTALDILKLVKDIPIILITATEDEQVVYNARNAGTFDFLPKDFDRKYLEDVPKTIESAIKHKKVEKALNREPNSLQAMFHAAPLGMLLVDENMIVTRANDIITQMLHRDYSQIVHHQLGFALGCINCTENHKGCGFGRSCGKCLLREGISEVLDSGQSVHDLYIYPILQIGTEQVKPTFRIGIDPVIIDGCTCVIVSLDCISQNQMTGD